MDDKEIGERGREDRPRDAIWRVEGMEEGRRLSAHDVIAMMDVLRYVQRLEATTQEPRS